MDDTIDALYNLIVCAGCFDNGDDDTRDLAGIGWVLLDDGVDLGLSASTEVRLSKLRSGDEKRSTYATTTEKPRSTRSLTIQPPMYCMSHEGELSVINIGCNRHPDLRQRHQ